MTLAEFFRRAERIVAGHGNDRDKVLPNGQTETSFAQAARVYTALTGNPMTETEALTFMQCVKLVRAERDPRFNRDHFDDLIGYTALKGVATYQEQVRDHKD